MFRCLSILFTGIFLTGCLNENPGTDLSFFGGDPSFTVTGLLAEGKHISALEVIDENNYYYSTGKKFFSVVDAIETSVELNSDILSIALDKTSQSLWLGTYSSGLACLKKGKISYYDLQNNQLPRNLVRDVVCDSKGQVWFNCSAHKLGGIGLFSDGNIDFFTPSNSILPDNLIKSISCLDNQIYIATGGTVTQQKVIGISEDGWKTLPITGYYLMDMDVASEGTIYVIDDTGLSSSMMTNKIYRYDNDGCRDILQQKSRFDENPYLLKTDRRNYLWVARFTSQAGKKQLTVFDGNNWMEAPEDFPDFYIKCMAVDVKNNIWLGTDQGIYILDQ